MEKKFVEVELDDGEYVDVMLLEEDTPEYIKGTTYYTSSAYGSAVVTDHLETGRPVTYNKKKFNITGITPVKTDAQTDAQYERQFDEGCKFRQETAKLFIKSDEQIVQIIDLYPLESSKTSPEMVYCMFLSTLPGTEASDGIPVVAAGHYYGDPTTTPEQVRQVLGNRFTYVSTSGKFLPETKICVWGKEVCTLATFERDKLSFKPVQALVADVIINTIKEVELS